MAVRLRPSIQPTSDGRRLAAETDRALRRLSSELDKTIRDCCTKADKKASQLSSDLSDLASDVADLGSDLAETKETIDQIQADLIDVEDNLTATQVGQVLFSVDGSTFTQEMPLTSDYGGWVSNDDGIMVVMG